MADTFSFDLVSPEREIMSCQVEEVVVPGVEGDFGVLAGHAPLMSAVAPGVLRVKMDGTATDIFIRGGFADVTAGGLTVLAEFAVPVSNLTGDVLEQQRTIAAQDMEVASGAGDILQAQLAQRTMDVLATL